MRKFIGENLSYPDAAREAGIEGTVVIRIGIDFKGKVGMVYLVRYTAIVENQKVSNWGNWCLTK